MDSPGFVIGVGSQRAGSTLLHRVLDECTEVFMHPIKELHYFDTLYGVRNRQVLVDFSENQLNHALDRIINSEDPGFIDKRFRCFLRANRMLANMPCSEIDYLDLYRPCVGDHRFLGEITPEYMILPEVGIENLAATVGRESKVVLITRDPIDRFVSAFKLLNLYGGKEYDMSHFSQDLMDVFEKMPGWIEQQDLLSDYDLAIAKYRRFFDHLVVVSYEDLVSNPEKVHKELETGFEIDIDYERYRNILRERVNAMGESAELEPYAMEFLRERYKNHPYVTSN